MSDRKTELQTLARFCVTKSPGFAAIALWVPYHATADPNFVAYTDGRQVVFGDKFWDYAPLERAFILCHEILHVALRHCPRGFKYARHSSAHAHIWNIACDAIINHALDGMDWLQTPGDGVSFAKNFGRTNFERPAARELVDRGALPQTVGTDRACPPMVRD